MDHKACPAWARGSLLALGTLLALPAGPAVAQAPPDGFWEVQGRAISGLPCGDWFVRLAVRQGQLYGIVGVGQGNVPIEQLTVQPDGSFTGATRAGHVNARSVRAYKVSGRFAGDRAFVTLENEVCPARQGTGWRRP